LAGNHKRVSERVSLLGQPLIQDIENYVRTFEAGRDELPPLKKKRERAIEEVDKVIFIFFLLFILLIVS
jgi:cobalamin biosynthesis Co2+ chelatase CbiK